MAFHIEVNTYIHEEEGHAAQTNADVLVLQLLKDATKGVQAGRMSSGVQLGNLGTLKTSTYILTYTVGEPKEVRKLAIFACVDPETRRVFFCAGRHDPRPEVLNGYMAFLSYMQENHAEGRHDGSFSDTLESLQECHANAQSVVQARAERQRLYNQKIQNAIEQNLDNMETLANRMNRIDIVEDSTDELELASTRFKAKANQVHDTAWWNLCKARCMGMSLGIVVLAAIGLGLYVALK